MSFFFYVDANVGVMTLAIERVHFCLQRKIWIDCLKRSEYRVYGRPSRRGIGDAWLITNHRQQNC